MRFFVFVHIFLAKVVKTAKYGEIVSNTKNTDGDTIRKAITEVKYDAITPMENRRLKNKVSPKRRNLKPFMRPDEGVHVKWFREDQQEQDYVQCHKLFTPFWTGEKIHPKNLNSKTYTPKDYMVSRFIQILHLEIGKFETDDLTGLMQVIAKLKLRLFSWHTNAIKMLFNTIIEGPTHNFNTLALGVKRLLNKWNITYWSTNSSALLLNSWIYRPTCLRLAVKGSTRFQKRESLATQPTGSQTMCLSHESLDEHYGHTHAHPENDHMQTKMDMAGNNEEQDIVRTNDKKYEQKDVNITQGQQGEQHADINDTNTGNEEEYKGYLEEELEKTDYAFPSMTELEQRELERIKKDENSDIEVKRAKANQYDLDELENYDLIESDLFSKEAGDVVTLPQDTVVTVGQPEQENEAQISHYDDTKEPNLEYEQSTEPIENENQAETFKTDDEKIYNQAEEYIDKLFADIDAK